MGVGTTVKVVALMAVPPGVVTRIWPLVAPPGTVVVIVVSSTTVSTDCVVKLKRTDVAPVKPVPVMVTGSPTPAAVGEKLVIVGGVFDRFPRLKIVLGHLGEGLPFWLYRIDFMHAGIVRAGRSEGVKPLKRKPSDYLRENFHITCSGMAWHKAIAFTQDVVGEDRVLYAMDYPYQYAIDEVHTLDGMDMNPAAKAKFYQTNAEKLFKIPHRSAA